jgi:hypothetical protein
MNPVGKKSFTDLLILVSAGDESADEPAAL